MIVMITNCTFDRAGVDALYCWHRNLDGTFSQLVLQMNWNYTHATDLHWWEHVKEMDYNTNGPLRGRA